MSNIFIMWDDLNKYSKRQAILNNIKQGIYNQVNMKNKYNTDLLLSALVKNK